MPRKYETRRKELKRTASASRALKVADKSKKLIAESEKVGTYVPHPTIPHTLILRKAQ